eukprot:7376084-Prymnesium_polylepis.1
MRCPIDTHRQSLVAKLVGKPRLAQLAPFERNRDLTVGGRRIHKLLELEGFPRAARIGHRGILIPRLQMQACSICLSNLGRITPGRDPTYYGFTLHAGQ